MIKNDNLKNKETIALPLGSSLTTLVVRFIADEAAKKMCYTFRVFVLLIKPIALFSRFRRLSWLLEPS